MPLQGTIQTINPTGIVGGGGGGDIPADALTYTSEPLTFGGETLTYSA